VQPGVGGSLAVLAASSAGGNQVPDRRATRRRAGGGPAAVNGSLKAGQRPAHRACSDEWLGWICATWRWWFFGCPGCFFSRGNPGSGQESHPSARGPLARFQEPINVSGVVA